MDALFTKEELVGSLLFKSKKSNRTALDEKRVDKLIGKLILHKCYIFYASDYVFHSSTACMEKKHGTDWDKQKFLAKANQKCRDTKIITID